MDKRARNREFMRRIRAKQHEFKYLANGQCPRCGMLLNPEYVKYHQTCSYFKEVVQPQKVDIKQKIVNN